MTTCPECHLFLVPSVRAPGAVLCPSPWGECDRSGVLLDRG